MKKPITLLIITLLILSGCGDGKQSDDGIITVDVTKSYPKKELILQDIFDVEYIPLETNDEFVTSGIIQYIGKDIIAVRNAGVNMAGDIFLFDRNGKALRKINRGGQAPEEYIYLGHIILDEENNEMFVICLTDNILVYDLFGNFKRRFNKIEGSIFTAMANFDQDHLIYYSNRYTVVDGNLELPIGAPENKFSIMSKKDGSISKTIEIPFNERKWAVIGTDVRQLSVIQNRLLTPIPYSNWIITEISSDTIYSVLPDFSIEPFIVRTPSIQSMEPEVFLYPGVFSDRYYFMQTVKREYDFATRTGWPRTELVYDRQENAIFEYVVYNEDFSDKTSVTLAFQASVISFDLQNEEIAFVQRHEAFDLVEAYNEGKLTGRLKEIAATLDEEDNAVIMIAKHKK